MWLGSLVIIPLNKEHEKGSIYSLILVSFQSVTNFRLTVLVFVLNAFNALLSFSNNILVIAIELLLRVLYKITRL